MNPFNAKVLLLHVCAIIALKNVQGIESRINTRDLNIFCQLDYLATHPPSRPVLPDESTEKLLGLLLRLRNCTAGEAHACEEGMVEVEHEAVNITKLTESDHQAALHQRIQRLASKMERLKQSFDRHASTVTESYDKAVKHLRESVYGSGAVPNVTRGSVAAGQLAEMFKPVEEGSQHMDKFCGKAAAANGAGVTISNDMMCMCAIRVGGSAARITHACGLKNSVAMEGYEVGHAYDAWEKIVILCDTSERAVDAAALRGALRSFSNSLGFLGKEDSPQYKSPHMLGSMGRHPKDGCTGDMGFQASLCVDYRALIDPDDEGTRNLRMIPWYNLVASAADLLDQGNNAAVAAARLHSQMQAIAEVALSIYYEGSGKVGCE